MRTNKEVSMQWLHRWGPAFVLFNGVTIASFAAGALVIPENFWAFFGVPDFHIPLARVMAWYLLIFGFGGMAIWREPMRHPWVVLLMGLEKLGPAVIFPWITLKQNGHWLLLGVGVADGLLSILLITYGWWLLRQKDVRARRKLYT